MCRWRLWEGLCETSKKVTFRARGGLAGIMKVRTKKSYQENLSLETLPEGKLRFIPLGGVGEIGKNMYAYHVLDQILIVDCGLKFPDEKMYGVDVVIPDVRYLVENKDAIQAVVLTHGHEDHIGALAYVMPQLPGVPVYGPRLALGLAKGRLQERRVLDKISLREFTEDSVIEVGHFRIEPIQVAHSIPDSFALAIHTPAGTVVHTGDFKLDQTPVDGRLFDIPKLARVASEGVLALVSDTTNIERPGYTRRPSRSSRRRSSG